MNATRYLSRVRTHIALGEESTAPALIADSLNKQVNMRPERLDEVSKVWIQNHKLGPCDFDARSTSAAAELEKSTGVEQSAALISAENAQCLIPPPTVSSSATQLLTKFSRPWRTAFEEMFGTRGLPTPTAVQGRKGTVITPLHSSKTVSLGIHPIVSPTRTCLGTRTSSQHCHAFIVTTMLC